MKITDMEKVKGLRMDPLKIEIARMGDRFDIKKIVLKILPSYLIRNSSISLVSIKTHEIAMETYECKIFVFPRWNLTSIFALVY